MAGALRIWRVPRTAGVTEIHACSSRRPTRRGERERNGSVLTYLALGVSIPSRTPAGQENSTEFAPKAAVALQFLFMRTAVSSLPWVSPAGSRRGMRPR